MFHFIYDCTVGLMQNIPYVIKAAEDLWGMVFWRREFVTSIARLSRSSNLLRLDTDTPANEALSTEFCKETVSPRGCRRQTWIHIVIDDIYIHYPIQSNAYKHEYLRNNTNYLIRTVAEDRNEWRAIIHDMTMLSRTSAMIYII